MLDAYAAARRVALTFWRICGPVVRPAIVWSYFRKGGPRRLQIGCGFNPLPGWLNTDLLPRRRGVVYLDATRRLPFPDRYFDYVYCEHLIEHLPYRAGRRPIEESARVLRPGGRIRLATPDLRFLLDLYAAKSHTQTQEHYVEYAFGEFIREQGTRQRGLVVNSFMRSWGHECVYDEDMLREVLASAGFDDLRRFEAGQSEDRNLRGIEQHQTRIPAEFNLLETMVIEAVRT